MTPRRIVALVSLVLTIAFSPAHASDKWHLTTKGYGPVRVGMTVDEASTALGVPFTLEEPVDDDPRGCRYATPERGFEGLAFMLDDMRVVRVDVETADYSTPSGAKVGMTEKQIKDLYPGRIRVSPHAYVDGHYLTYVPKDAADKNYRIVFETDGKRVTSMRSGKLPDVEYIEGCS